MNYYYDIVLNWCDKYAYLFYEWNKSDYLELIKKIPIFKIKHKNFIDVSSYNIKVSEDFLKLIYEKTLLKDKDDSKLLYACLLTDGKNVLALEFNDKGHDINRSNLTLEDELNIIEISFTLKEYNLNYDLVNKIKQPSTLRQIEDTKHFVLLELNSLYKNKDIAKLQYLYYECKKKRIDNLDIIYKELSDDVKHNFNKDILKLCYIIKLSYYKV